MECTLCLRLHVLATNRCYDSATAKEAYDVMERTFLHVLRLTIVKD
jgi:hypothetical protein